MSISCLSSSASNPMFLKKLPTPGSLPCPEPMTLTPHRSSSILMDNTIFLWCMRRSPNILPRPLCCRHLLLSLGRMISAISHRLRTATSRILSVRMARCWRGRQRRKGIWWTLTGANISISILLLLAPRMLPFSTSNGLMSSCSFFFVYILFLCLFLSLRFWHHIHHTFPFHLTSHSRKRNETTWSRIHSYFSSSHRHFSLYIPHRLIPHTIIN